MRTREAFRAGGGRYRRNPGRSSSSPFPWPGAARPDSTEDRTARLLLLGARAGEDAELDREVVRMVLVPEYRVRVLHHVHVIERRRADLAASWPALGVQGLVLALAVCLLALLA